MQHFLLIILPRTVDILEVLEIFFFFYNFFEQAGIKQELFYSAVIFNNTFGKFQKLFHLL